MMAPRPALPIDALLDEAVRVVRAGKDLVVEAAPGAGKTTRLPAALLQAVRGAILVAEPRRLAARLPATYVAHERGQRLGQEVGYQVRFEGATSPETRLCFVTEALLLRRCVQDRSLAGVDVVVLDEFHERHLTGDVLLACLRALQQTTRPDLRIVVMSATLDAARVASFLGDCPRLTSHGRTFEVTLAHQDYPDDRPLDKQVASALLRLLKDGLDGDVLVFLPGVREIRRAAQALGVAAKTHQLAILPLYGTLPFVEQERALARWPERKVVLATNVAETSVTIDGIVAVVDSGLARVPFHSPWTGLPELAVAKISRASATQRSGRAGRTAPGRCLRLYTQHDHDTRPAYDRPEIHRLDLAETLLVLTALVPDVASFAWFDPPPTPALEAAHTLLERLGAFAADGTLSPTGRRMLAFPVHPRLARVLVAGEALGVGAPCAQVAAVLSERDLGRGGAHRDARTSGPSDVLDDWESFLQVKQARFAPHVADAWGIDLGAARAVDRAASQLVRLCDRGVPTHDDASRPGKAGPRAGAPTARSHSDVDTALQKALLAGFSDRVAKRRAPGSRELVLCHGGALQQSPASIVGDAPLVIVVDAQARPGAVAHPLADKVSAIEAGWLLDDFPERLRETSELIWDGQNARVVVVSRLFYETLILDEQRRPPHPSELTEAGALVGQAAVARGVDSFVDNGALATFRARVAFCARHAADAGFSELAPAAIDGALTRAAQACISFVELGKRDVLAFVRALLAPAQLAALDRFAPEYTALPGKKRVRIHYAEGQEPFVSARLQDFFGLTETPKIAGGRVPLVVHLNAPNQRAVQVTTDLASFWRTHYPALRKQLSRRYPKHKWPEDPVRK